MLTVKSLWSKRDNKLKSSLPEHGYSSPTTSCLGMAFPAAVLRQSESSALTRHACGTRRDPACTWSLGRTTFPLPSPKCSA